jgi:hypothetical protein
MTGPGPVPSDEHGWLDRLVDLHVLAANGDTAAAEAARRWLARDTQARQVWDQVQHTCDRIQNARTGGATT